jgi:hypothetical protein
MHDAVEQLTRLLPGPHPGQAKDWAAVEGTLGTGLPSDYREFVETVGGGYVDSYLDILEPDGPNENDDLADATEERTEAFEHLWDSSGDRPAELDEEGARLIPFASTDNGEFLHWLARPGQAPAEWTVMVDEARGERWERYSLGFAPRSFSARSPGHSAPRSSPTTSPPTHTPFSRSTRPADRMWVFAPDGLEGDGDQARRPTGFLHCPGSGRQRQRSVKWRSMGAVRRPGRGSSCRRRG